MEPVLVESSGSNHGKVPFRLFFTVGTGEQAQSPTPAQTKLRSG